MKKLLALAFAVCLAIPSWGGTESSSNPRVAILISRTSYKQSWETTQMAGHAWAGIANLAGLPYDTLFVEELPAPKELSKYSALVFAQAKSVDNATYNRLVSDLGEYASAGGSLILDGPLAIQDDGGKEREHGTLDKVIGVSYGGAQGGTEFRVRNSPERHWITRTFMSGQFLSPILAAPVEVLKPASGGAVLLSLTSRAQSFPYLSVAIAKGRTVLISDFGTTAGPGTFFRNDKPQLAYDNQLWTAMIRALQWATYGQLNVPFPAPQVSNANMTAVVRLDADNSGNLQYQLNTLDFLADVAQETGVVPLYAWLSSEVAKAGWDKVAPLGKRLELLGGEIGTHSKFHEIDRKMTEQRWRDELDGSIQEIESNMQAQGYPIRKIRSMINPGDTIPMEDYGQVASRFSLYMTHGFEQTTPIGFGNMTWYTGANKDFVLLENSPHPDYQWFYDPTWSYTTAQITSNEESIIDHLFHSVGRGVIFNEMWHDYSISSMPVGEGKDVRITNTYNLPMYEAVRTKWATLPIYAPEPTELAEKLRGMAKWTYSWKASDNAVELTLSIPADTGKERPDFTGGMGVRIENTGKFINAVSIDGQPHPAFSDRVVILPALSRGTHTVKVSLGPHPAAIPHLSYLSKTLTSTSLTPSGMRFTVKAKAKARFSVVAEGHAVLLNADSQAWDEGSDRAIDGFVLSDRKVEIFRPNVAGFRVLSANRAILNVNQQPNALALKLAAGGAGSPEFIIRSAVPLREVLFGGTRAEVVREGQRYEIKIPGFDKDTEMVLKFSPSDRMKAEGK